MSDEQHILNVRLDDFDILSLFEVLSTKTRPIRIQIRSGEQAFAVWSQGEAILAARYGQVTGLEAFLMALRAAKQKGATLDAWYPAKVPGEATEPIGSFYRLALASAFEQDQRRRGLAVLPC